MGSHMGVKKLVKTDGKGNKKLQNGYKSLQKFTKRLQIVKFLTGEGCLGKVYNFGKIKRGKFVRFFG